MKIAAKIFEKATVRGLADYLIYGLPPNPDERDYKARLDETYDEFEKIALKYEPDRASELLSSANNMTCENASVYLEIGIQAGFLLIADMMKNIQNECQGEEETIDYHDRNRVMVKDIMRALELLTDETRDIQQACEILEKWGKPESGMQEEKQ